MTETENLQVGDAVYYVPRYGVPTTLTVVKAGRLWADVGRKLQISVAPKKGAYPAKADRKGFGSPGNAYRSEADYRLSLRPEKLRQAIATAITAWTAPRTYTLEQLECAAKALGIEVSP